MTRKCLHLPFIWNEGYDVANKFLVWKVEFGITGQVLMINISEINNVKVLLILI
jgi:hypothetical protein